MTTGIRKVRKGVDVFDKRSSVLVSSSLDTVLQNAALSFPCSWRSRNRFYSAKYTLIRILIQGLLSTSLYPTFTESSSLSKVYRVPVSFQGLQSSHLFTRFTEFLSAWFAEFLYPWFTEFTSLSRIH